MWPLSLCQGEPAPMTFAGGVSALWVWASVGQGKRPPAVLSHSSVTGVCVKGSFVCAYSHTCWAHVTLPAVVPGQGARQYTLHLLAGVIACRLFG
jgi:hypothetical protein